MQAAFFNICLVGIVLFAAGCGNVGDSSASLPPPGANAKTAQEYVNESNMGKMIGTSGARYKPDSAKDLGGNKFEIQDTAGGKYEVTVTSEGTGFTSTEPQPVK